MSTFIPTTEGVRNSYVYSTELDDGTLAAPKEVLGAEFDRWLAQHDAETEAQALEEAAEICYRIQSDPEFPESGPGVRAAKIVLRAEAARIRQEANK